MVTTPQLYAIARIEGAMLYAMAKPSAEFLDRDISALKDLGISNVICLLETTESSELGLDNEHSACTARGLTFSRFPIKDYGVPEPTLLHPFINTIYTDICNGAATVVHCRGGIGRTGLVCACLLIKAGYSTENAIALVTEKRQKTVPETAEQIATIMSFSKYHSTTQE